MPINTQTLQEMLRRAEEARERAYVPYSGFHVGACLQAASGRLYTGCNIENAAYSPTNCAERTAVFKAVSEGEREFTALVITWDGADYAAPCGVCRQVLAEFCPGDMPVVCANAAGEYVEYTLRALLPAAFTAKDMQK